eukprot:Gb_12771 [translate_table: standard]
MNKEEEGPQKGMEKSRPNMPRKGQANACQHQPESVQIDVTIGHRAVAGSGATFPIGGGCPPGLIASQIRSLLAYATPWILFYLLAEALYGVTREPAVSATLICDSTIWTRFTFTSVCVGSALGSLQSFMQKVVATAKIYSCHGCPGLHYDIYSLLDTFRCHHSRVELYCYSLKVSIPEFGPFFFTTDLDSRIVSFISHVDSSKRMTIFSLNGLNYVIMASRSSVVASPDGSCCCI